ncbi:MAG TPA: phosphate/phosphite/phosphonate ABC transporter substrate-binding protein [Rhodocyclaceae bacterium]|nr:phosphate/phosphite/phosphonate ABC transporter substrate-binding protein [Rhodocyclaceae bacterium]
MNRRAWILSALSALLGYAADGLAQTPGTPFRIGVAPHTSTRVIVEMYQPLRLFLEKTLGRPVEIVTAADFTEFARRAVQQQYDLAITTGHQVRMLESDSGYLPLLTYKAEFKAVALVEASSRFREPKDLAGTPAIGLSPASLVTIWGQHWLLRNSVPGVTIRFVSASDSVAQLLLAGEGSVGFTSLANYQSLAPAVQGRLRILAESLPMAGRVYALNRRNAAQKEKISAALWAFAETDEAKQYFSKYRLEGYRRLEPRELIAMEPYANEVRQALKREK